MDHKIFINSFLNPLYEICGDKECLRGAYLQIYRIYMLNEFSLSIKDLGDLINRKKRNSITKKQMLIERELLIELPNTFQLRLPSEALEILKKNTKRSKELLEQTKKEVMGHI